MKRYRLSNKQLKELEQKYSFLSSIIRSGVELIEFDDDEKLYISVENLLPILYELKIEDRNIVIPTLYLVHRFGVLVPEPYVVVDQGAVKHILNGADIMRPGITEFSQFKRGDIVFVLDPKRRAIAVGVALVDSGDLQNMQKGKVVKNVHYLGDDIWNFRM